MKKTLIAACILQLPLLSGCFTGVESTPKITYKEVKHNKAEGSSKEESLANSFVPQPFAKWQAGKPFYVTSERIGLVVKPEESEQPALATGNILIYQEFRNVTDLTGEEVVELVMSLKDNPKMRYSYRTNATAEKLNERANLEIPFAIDLDLLNDVKIALVGKELYVKTPNWNDINGNAVNGRQFIPVHITDVVPANEVYPYMVIFNDDNNEKHALYMSAAAGMRWMPRVFHTLFSFDNPRLNYPQITEEIWNSIINARVMKGMTKNEAKLAVGNPRNIDRGHDNSSAYEQWSYSDGRYLIFQDGLLIRFNK